MKFDKNLMHSSMRQYFPGINYVLKSLKFQPHDEILLTSHTYLAVQNTAKDIEEHDGE